MRWTVHGIAQTYKMFLENPLNKDNYLGDPTADAMSILKLPYFSIDNAHPQLMYTAVYRACSFFTNLDLFCIDNARVIYRKIRQF